MRWRSRGSNDSAARCAAALGSVIAGSVIAIVTLTSCSSGSSHSSTAPTTVADTRPRIVIAPSAWKDVAQGTFRAQPWTVAYARSASGWRCYDPQGAAKASTAPSTATSAPPTRLGRTTACLAPTPSAGPLRFTAFIGGADANQWELVGAVADGVKQVNIEFHDGTTTRLGIDPHTRLVEWKGPAALAPSRLHTDATTCALDPARQLPKEELCAGLTP